MLMDRLVLSDAAWERIAPLIIGRPDQKGSTGRDNRMFVECEPRTFENSLLRLCLHRIYGARSLCFGTLTVNKRTPNTGPAELR